MCVWPHGGPRYLCEYGVTYQSRTDGRLYVGTVTAADAVRARRIAEIRAETVDPSLVVVTVAFKSWTNVPA